MAGLSPNSNVDYATEACPNPHGVVLTRNWHEECWTAKRDGVSKKPALRVPVLHPRCKISKKSLLNEKDCPDDITFSSLLHGVAMSFALSIPKHLEHFAVLSVPRT